MKGLSFGLCALFGSCPSTPHHPHGSQAGLTHRRVIYWEKKSTPALSRLQKRSLLFSSGAIYRRQAKPEHNQSIVTVDFKEELALAHNGYRQTQEKLETEMCLNFSKHRRALFMLHFQIAFSLILLCKFEHFWANIHHCRI